MGLLVDLTPLWVTRDFRRLCAGQAVSFIGSTMTTAAPFYRVFHPTGATLTSPPDDVRGRVSGVELAVYAGAFAIWVPNLARYVRPGAARSPRWAMGRRARPGSLDVDRPTSAANKGADHE